MTGEQLRSEAAVAGRHVGPGVAAAIARAGDWPAGDELELRPGWTITPGRERAYLWSEASDAVYAVPKV